MACSKGIFFANVKDLGMVEVVLNSNECYLRNQDVKAAVEFKKDLIAACIDGDQSIHIIDRKTKGTIRTIDNPSGSDDPLCFRLAPAYDYEKFPFAFLRDKEGVSVVNLKTSQAYKIIQNMYVQLPYPQMLMEVQKSQDPTTQSLIIYLLEYNGKDSNLVKYELTPDFVGGLRVMARNDF